MEDLLQELGARGAGGINPEESQLLGLLQSGHQGPLQFVNFLAFREMAIYPAGHELRAAGLTGVQAYNRYGAIALELVERLGATLIVYNDVQQTLIGQMRPWDQMLVVEFPDTDAFVKLMRDADYKAALVHRDAGLADVVILITRSLLPL